MTTLKAASAPTSNAAPAVCASAAASGALPIESIVHNNLGELDRRLGRLPASLDQLDRSHELKDAPTLIKPKEAKK